MHRKGQRGWDRAWRSSGVGETADLTLIGRGTTLSLQRLAKGTPHVSPAEGTAQPPPVGHDEALDISEASQME